MNSLTTNRLDNNNWIFEECQNILYYIDQNNINNTEIKKHLRILINSLNNVSNKEKYKLLNKLQDNRIKEICCQIMLNEQNDDFYREKATNHQFDYTVHYNLLWPDQMDEKAYWFRKYFVGKPYITLVGPFYNDFAIFSIVREIILKDQSQYRIIVRTKENNMGFIVNEKDVNEMISQLEYLNQLNRLDIEIETKRHKPLRSFSSAIITSMSSNSVNLTFRSMRAALLFLFQDINFKLFKEFTAETTIMLGLEKEFLKYDEIGIPKYYKFGVLTIKEDQYTEEEWFSNNDLSDELIKFLNIIGRPIILKDYKGYAAGLDTKTGESGEISFVNSWKDHEIMFHVAPLIPSKDNDVQQINRKRHIGNDIVSIIFMEGKQKFNPNSIKSQFLHVFIVVYYEFINNKDTWRVQVFHNKNVKSFSPPIPNPPIFDNEDELRNFLILKLINAENSSLKSEKFILPNNKARTSILKSLIETGLDANIALYDKKYMTSERPKSAGAQHRTIKVIERPLTPELPPIPAISRSSMLRDIKSLTRRKSNSQQCYQQRIHEDTSDEGSQKNYNQVNEQNTIETNHTGSGIRSKAHNLVSSMIGRRNSRTGRTILS